MSKPASRQSRRLPFRHDKQLVQLDKVITARIGRQARTLQEGVIDPGNFMRLKHGKRWRAGFSDRPDESTGLELQSTETAVPFARVVDHDLTILRDFLINLPKKMRAQFMGQMFKVLDRSTSQSGNVVSGLELKAGFLEMLRKIEFGVDRWGVPSRPTMHATPKVFQKMRQLDPGADEAFKREVAEINARKEKNARANEARRISKFKLPK